LWTTQRVAHNPTATTTTKAVNSCATKTAQLDASATHTNPARGRTVQIVNPGLGTVPAIRSSLSAWSRSRSPVRAPSLKSRVAMLLTAMWAAGAVRLRVETPDGHAFQIDFPSTRDLAAERNDFDAQPTLSKRTRQRSTNPRSRDTRTITVIGTASSAAISGAVGSTCHCPQPLLGEAY
jgi:hypothetical protein